MKLIYIISLSKSYDTRYKHHLDTQKPLLVSKSHIMPV